MERTIVFVIRSDAAVQNWSLATGLEPLL